MADHEKKALEIESLEVAELEDEDLDDVSGGSEPTNSGCPITNSNCPSCQLPQPQFPSN
jgi:hypothetical protein